MQAQYMRVQSVSSCGSADCQSPECASAEAETESALDFYLNNHEDKKSEKSIVNGTAAAFVSRERYVVLCTSASPSFALI